MKIAPYGKLTMRDSVKLTGGLLANESMILLRSADNVASIAPLGAELRTFSVAGRELLWLPDARLWDGTSQVLFPVIGRVVGDVIRVDGRTYPMPGHGFALTSVFSVIESAPDACTLELRANPTTRRHYPYEFILRLSYRLWEMALSIQAEIINEGETTMPAGFGMHPGFRWPLLPGVPKERHRISFGHGGPIASARPVDRLVGPDRSELLLEGDCLWLSPSLFDKSGLALVDLQQRSLCYQTDDGLAGIRIAFPDMDRVMLWSRPGGDYLCIEPLLSHADPLGFAGDIMEKPGMAHIPPGGCLTLSITITPEFA